MKIHGIKVCTLLYSGAALNVTSPKLVNIMSLKSEWATKVVTMVNSSRSGVDGKVKKVLVQFEGVVKGIDFVVLKNVSFILIIGHPALKRLGNVINFRSGEVRLDFLGQEAKLPMILKYSCLLRLINDTDSENFTSDSDEKEAESEMNNDGEELVLTIRDDTSLERKMEGDENNTEKEKWVLM